MSGSLLVPCKDSGREEITREEEFVDNIDISLLASGFSASGPVQHL